ncbi:MAG TPA: MFS transporter [Bryobacteraceae bacterium]|nr:MFS transporter [Bryobacteraceae bacterium]
MAILLYFVAYLDRANVGFAKLRMADDLGFSEEVFGLGIGIFFLGYLTLEIPGALLVERWSARKWFARILVTWGMLASPTAFVQTPGQFYLARFFLGVAEAGFFPGIIVYFTHWFPMRDRARAMSGFIVAIPLSLAFGAPISGLLLNVDWLGWKGWQWLFVLEGLPAVILGIVAYVILTDRPQDAKWLTPAERDYLEGVLAEEARAKDLVHKFTIGQALRSSNVWLLSFGIFATNMGGYALTFWMPTTVKSISGGSDLASLFYSGLFYLCGLVGVLYSGFAADRTGNRKRTCIAGQLATGIFLAMAAIPGQSFPMIMTWLILTGLTAHSWPPPFWALPTLTLTHAAAAASIGFINIFANLAGYFSNHIIGWIKDRGASDSTCLFLLAGWYLLGAAIISFVRTKPQTEPTALQAALVNSQT